MIFDFLLKFDEHVYYFLIAVWLVFFSLYYLYITDGGVNPTFGCPFGSMQVVDKMPESGGEWVVTERPTCIDVFIATLSSTLIFSVLSVLLVLRKKGWLYRKEGQ